MDLENYPPVLLRRTGSRPQTAISLSSWFSLSWQATDQKESLRNRHKRRIRINVMAILRRYHFHCLIGLHRHQILEFQRMEETPCWIYMRAALGRLELSASTNECHRKDSVLMWTGMCWKRGLMHQWEFMEKLHYFAYVWLWSTTSKMTGWLLPSLQCDLSKLN